VNRFGHVDLRVPDLAAATPFYDALAAALGYAVPYHGNGWRGYGTPDALPQGSYLAVTEEPGHVPNSNRIAFWCADDAEVDALARVIREAGATRVEGPGPEQMGPTPYYAVYFEDPCGNRFEAYCRRMPGQA
jgi:catechol 2,3-dioxygenase-like lactoylglutathione lyase family enzyme